MRRAQVFDVNETLLDLAAMDPHFERVFGDAGLRSVWFAQMIQSALVATITGAYRQFGAHAMAALAMTAEHAGVRLADDDRDAAFSVYYFVAFFSDPIWSLVTGVLMENFGFAFAFSRLSVTYLLGMALLFLLRDTRRPGTEGAAA
jgi:hypothetical protein